MVPAVLAKIKQEYNAKHRDHPIQQTDPVGIWQELHQRLKSCESEKCWLSIIDDSNERNKLKGKILRPDQPKEWKSNPDEWLSNYDIFNVAVQYEEEYPHFEMIGPSAIDFDTVLSSGDCVQKELCHFSLKDLIKKGKRDIGVVFNLDKHNEPGSHWVSLYVHVPAIANRDDFPFMFYFDSAGDDVPEEVTQLMNRIAKEGEEMDPTIVFKQYNNDGHDHQKGNTECGMYSLFFIITMLTGSTPFHPKTMTVQERIHLFTQKKIDDKVVFDYRDLYFNP
jgi:hypothetical protein